ncbi:MAG: hypothetical protein K2H86_03275 [Muribaculaceae bacterium]|nr:hypothetical protein [Muribaculaceae bacterium]
MKYLLTILTCCLATISSFALPKGFFAPRSVMSDGNWVKVSVLESGVHEISYQTLRAMGFPDPEKVGVYGRGGAILNTDFTNSNDVPSLTDDIEPIAVLHLNDKIYFYAEGVDTHSFSMLSSLAPGGYFQRESKNVYSNYGFYFLSDYTEPMTMSVSYISAEGANGTTSTGYGMVYHEVDLIHNNSNTGQLFFGEKLAGDTSRIEWPLSLPGCIANQIGVMECYFYLDRDVSGRLLYGVKDSDTYADFNTKTYASTEFRAQEPNYAETRMNGENSTLFVEFRTSDDVDIAHLDYWTLTYPRYLPNLRDNYGNRLNQEYICFPSIPRNRTWAATFNNAGSMVILNITDRRAPVVLEGELRGADKTVHITNTNKMPELVVFDPLQTQKQISGYDTSAGFMQNQNLHGQVADGADLLIIHIPALKEQAHKIADLHQKYEGIKVVTASTEEVYNEFSQGIPDPMAYRAFVKAAFETSNPVKNLLLLGPLAADFRGIRTERNRDENIIAYQSHPMNQLRGAQNANDFYGMMSDFIGNTALEKCTMHVGVGVLPCRFPAEAEIFVKKLETYLSRNDFAYFSNRFLNIGGIGDNHTHDMQARNIGNDINTIDLGSSIITPLIIDAYGHDPAHDKLFDVIEDGSVNVIYFGHGSPRLLGREGNFFTINDVYKLRNSFHPFMGFAGCELSNCDRGVRGLGEALVTATPYGVIGTLLATRETWSGQNYDLFQTFVNCMFGTTVGGQHSLYTETPTIGEIFARAKTKSSYNNELAYQLLCDPALKMPMITRPVILDSNKYEVRPGEYNTITGFIAKSSRDKEIDTSFNGEIVLRLMEPYVQLTSQDLCTSKEGNTQEMVVNYADTQVAMTSATVENGRFTAEIFVPAVMTEYAGRIGRLHSCAYNPETRQIAAAMNSATYTKKGDVTAQDGDVTPPVIDLLEYDETDNVIRVAAHDDLGLSYNRQPLTDSFILKIDGKINHTAARHEAAIGDCGRSLSKDIPLNDLTEGTHTAILTIADVAGNTATREITFTYAPTQARYAIRLIEGAVSDCATIEVGGPVMTQADIIFMDINGNIIKRAPLTGTEYRWDATDMTGTRVAPGLYKAYLLETGQQMQKGHSSTIDIPVI